MDLAVDRTWNGWVITHEMENLAMQDMPSQFKNKMVFLELGVVHSATDLACRPTVFNETRERNQEGGGRARAALPWGPCDADADSDLCKTEEWDMSDVPHPMLNPDELPADPEDYPSLLKRVSFPQGLPGVLPQPACSSVPWLGVGAEHQAARLHSSRGLGLD
jgi:hypothetical protein